VSEEPVFRLLVVTPDDVVIDQPVVSVRFQEPDGWRGILAHHALYVTQLIDGVMIYRLPGEAEPRYLALYGGTLEVQPDKIVVLTAAAEHGDSLQVLLAAIQRRQEEADAVALEAHIEFAKVRAALARALIHMPVGPEVG
jgi:F-type H+-transporting ATPase subunit epsilon